MAAQPNLPESFVPLKIAQIKNIANGFIALQDDVMAALGQEYANARVMMSGMRIAVVLLVGLGAGWRMADFASV